MHGAKSVDQRVKFPVPSGYKVLVAFIIKYLLDQHCHALPSLLSVTLIEIFRRVLNSLKIGCRKNTLYDDLQAFLPTFREHLATCLSEKYKFVDQKV